MEKWKELRLSDAEWGGQKGNKGCRLEAKQLIFWATVSPQSQITSLKKSTLLQIGNGSNLFVLIFQLVFVNRYLCDEHP